MKDECFIRGKVPMTKSEIRAIVLSKLQINRNSIIYDIGAGTGSVSVEAAGLADQGHVYAFEQKPEACELIRQNAGHFGRTNLTLIEGLAPDTLVGVPEADGAFIGGSSGNMESILQVLFAMNPMMRVVITAITLETIGQVLDYVKAHECEAEIVSVQVNKAETAGRFHMMKAQNPVYIITIEEGTAK
ncbi:MAG: precorrin-6Y C5,15-methyltransferase (decarboxylating) subunit CbiT [Lachnospiraceae bacterium]